MFCIDGSGNGFDIEQIFSSSNITFDRLAGLALNLTAPPQPSSSSQLVLVAVLVPVLFAVAGIGIILVILLVIVVLGYICETLPMVISFLSNYCLMQCLYKKRLKLIWFAVSFQTLETENFKSQTT